jgi:hypothetical protein
VNDGNPQAAAQNLMLIDSDRFYRNLAHTSIRPHCSQHKRAYKADGSYISNVPAYTYTDATSSVPIAEHIATSKTDPTAATAQ